ncbi:MAG: hypothetical protein RR718_00210 [Comamonas sp.]
MADQPQRAAAFSASGVRNARYQKQSIQRSPNIELNEKLIDISMK